MVAINTAGGLTGGDRFDLAVDVEEQAHAVVTTAACEKIYRAADGEAVVKSAVTIGSGARLEWLPQPMIMFDGARVRRSLSVDVAVGATLLAVEGVILGRTAMGEELRSARIHDGWRVRRAGDLRGDLAGQATLRGARAFATVLYVAPDAEEQLPAARTLLADCSGETGASTWAGQLAVRFLAADGQMLVSDLGRFLVAFRNAPLPRSWLC